VIVVLSLLRGAHFHLSPGRTLVGLAAGGLLAGGTYALAECLAYSLKQPQVFGTLIPAIGATPYLLCGALYPIAALPDGVRQFAWTLPWTHAVALLRDGFIGSRAAKLEQIWHLQSEALMVVMSLAVLAVFAALMIAIAIRAFRRATLA
jgi:ABC-type polysaccharide/polyol phosphate export permease